jgi:hypothetical protein
MGRSSRSAMVPERRRARRLRAGLVAEMEREG